jgi:hypothetical protein
MTWQDRLVKRRRRPSHIRQRGEDVKMIQNQHLTDLERALGQLREQRRNWVRTLAAGAGHERGKTESAIESFLKCQTAIEAVGRAIDDERKIVPEASKPKAP